MLLKVDNIQINYDNHLAIKGCSIQINEGEIVGLFGHNGAGKSSILKSILGYTPVNEGQIYYKGKPITGRNISENTSEGITLIPQGFGVFSDLTVEENLKLAVHNSCLPKAKINSQLNIVYDLFPILYEKRKQKANFLSGGQQQMVKMGMGLMKNPTLMLLDEPSLGLSPALAEMVLEKVAEFNKMFNMAVLIVEQNVSQTLFLVDRVYFLRMGQIIHQVENVEEIKSRDNFWEFF
ncbi:ABC transporter ATP-binding protein [Bacillus sp. Marseille-P3661]|uniref:ABC transporter ATP-binding protein n=1 Tax=Bacillus sp. Marseille-P3661 TaxID=1936234 RepID=UPI000C843F0C|nr:ABC transporter ATP-binding protein [Bacillus sp. Marseille-P3661]